MTITTFTHEHIKEATALALANYQEERFYVPTLPLLETVLDLIEFADNELGMVAFDSGIMVGFLCFCFPWDNVFTTYAKGTFSPIYAHGVVTENRENIYKRLYQAAAENWLRKV